MHTTAQRQFDPTDGLSVSEAVVSAVATAADIDPVDVTPRLYDVVDPDALERLFEHGAGSAELAVTFEYDGWHVGIENGLVTVTDGTETARTATKGTV